MNCNTRLIISIFKKANFIQNKDPRYHAFIKQRKYFDDINEESSEAYQVALWLNAFLSNIPSSCPVPESSNSDNLGDYDELVANEATDSTDSDSSTPGEKSNQNFYFLLSDLNLSVEDEYLLGKRLLKLFAFVALVRPSKFFISQGETEYFDETETNMVNEQQSLIDVDISEGGKICMSKDNAEELLRAKHLISKIKIIEINLCLLLIFARSFDESDKDLLDILIVLVTFQNEFFLLSLTEKEYAETTRKIFSKNESVYFLIFTLIHSKKALLQKSNEDVTAEAHQEKFKLLLLDTISSLLTFEDVDSDYVDYLRKAVELSLEASTPTDLLTGLFSAEELRRNLVSFAIKHLKEFREKISFLPVHIEEFEDLTAVQKLQRINELRKRLNLLAQRNEFMIGEYNHQLKLKDESISKLNMIIEDIKDNSFSLENQLRNIRTKYLRDIKSLKEDQKRELTNREKDFKVMLEDKYRQGYNDGKTAASSGTQNREKQYNELLSKKKLEVEKLKSEISKLKYDMYNMKYGNRDQRYYRGPTPPNNGYHSYAAAGSSTAAAAGYGGRDTGYDDFSFDYYGNSYYGKTHDDGTSDQPIAIDDDEAVKRA